MNQSTDNGWTQLKGLPDMEVKRYIKLSFNDFHDYPNLYQMIWDDVEGPEISSQLEQYGRLSMMCVPEDHPSFLMLELMFPNRIITLPTKHVETSAFKTFGIFSPNDLTFNQKRI